MCAIFVSQNRIMFHVYVKSFSNFEARLKSQTETASILSVCVCVHALDRKSVYCVWNNNTCVHYNSSLIIAKREMLICKRERERKTPKPNGVETAQQTQKSQTNKQPQMVVVWWAPAERTYVLRVKFHEMIQNNNNNRNFSQWRIFVIHLRERLADWLRRLNKR